MASSMGYMNIDPGSYLSDSVPPRSTGAKSHGRMDHPMVKGAVVCNTGESFVLSL